MATIVHAEFVRPWSIEDSVPRCDVENSQGPGRDQMPQFPRVIQIGVVGSLFDHGCGDPRTSDANQVGHDFCVSGIGSPLDSRIRPDKFTF